MTSFIITNSYIKNERKNFEKAESMSRRHHKLRLIYIGEACRENVLDIDSGCIYFPWAMRHELNQLFLCRVTQTSLCKYCYCRYSLAECITVIFARVNSALIRSCFVKKRNSQTSKKTVANTKRWTKEIGAIGTLPRRR